MIRRETPLPGVLLLEPRVVPDARGWFMQTYHARQFRELGIDRAFVQDNVSRSTRGVLRGLHYQLRQPQAKLIRVSRGEVFDVAVDIRRGSPTFGQWSGHLLSEENRLMLFIPEGFAHGFYVVSGEAELHYKCSDFYAPQEERGLAWNDQELAIHWPFPPEAKPILSERDRQWGTLATCPQSDLPVYDGTDS